MKLHIKSDNANMKQKHWWELRKDSGELIAKSDKMFGDRLAALKEVQAVQGAIGRLKIENH